MKDETKPLEEQTAQELVAYIKGVLRPELQQRREASEVYASAFANLSVPEQKGMLNIVRAFGENREDGADLFQQLVDNVKKTPKKTTPKEEEKPVTEQSQEVSEDEVPAWAQALIGKIEAMEAAQISAAEAERAEGVAQVKAEAVALGYVEGTEAWNKMLAFAGNPELANGDLNAAHDMMGKVHPDLAPKAAEPTEEEAAAAAAAAAAPEAGPEGDAAAADAAPRFPVSGSAGGSGAPGSGAASQEKPDLSKGAVQAAALAAMEAFGSDNASTP